MDTVIRNVTLIGLFVLLLLAMGAIPDTKKTINEKKLLKDSKMFFGTIADSMATTGPLERVKLGRMLYYDARLSQSGKVSCVSCHDLNNYGVDNFPISIGNDRNKTTYNSPTVLNSIYSDVYSWHGNWHSLEEQIVRPLEAHGAMGITDREAIVRRFAAIPEYVRQFERAFPGDTDVVSYRNLCIALAAFERTLVASSRFDKYLLGDKSALTQQEKQGLNAFIFLTCHQCHDGPAFGGVQVEAFGTANRQYWLYTQSKVIDSGAYKSSRDTSDIFHFRVPPLRNVEKTYPYFHDGSVEKLDDAVRVMLKVQLNKELPDDDIEDLTAFLKTLTSDLRPRLLEKPVLPPESESK